MPIPTFERHASNSNDGLRWGAFGRYTRRLTPVRVAAARIWLSQAASPTASGRDASHNIDIGVDYAQPFTFGRGRTTFSLSTGTALLVRDDLDDRGGSANSVKFLALGRAILRHDFVRSWQAQLSYVRSLQFIDGINDPFLSDRVHGRRSAG